MSINKHDSTIILELLGALIVVALFSMVAIGFNVQSSLSTQTKEMKAYHAMQATPAKDMMTTITADDLDPELINQINQSFGTIIGDMGQVQFVLQKLIAENFTEDELKAMQEEYKAILEQQAKSQAQAQNEAPAATPAQ